MAQPGGAGGRMYRASQFRHPGDFPPFFGPSGGGGGPQAPHRYNPHRSVQVYSITRYSNNQNSRGRGGGGRGGAQRGGGRPPFHNNFNNHRPNGRYVVSDLEWDNFDIGTNKSSRGRRRARQNGRDAYYRIGTSFSSSDSELEWDDYDLQNKDEAEAAEAATAGSLGIFVSEEFVPLITEAGSLSRGHIPIGAIQVRKLPPGSSDQGILLRGEDLSLLLAQEVNNNNSSSETSYDDTISRIQEFLAQSGLDTTEKMTQAILKRRSSDSSSQKTDRTPDSEENNGDSPSSESDALLEDEYEPNYQEKLADADLYALLPPDLDSPDSLLSRSLADLTDQTLYEEYGLETRRRDNKGELITDKDKLAKERRKAAAKAKKRKQEGDGQRRQAPNFFVAIQVCNPEVVESLRLVQQAVLDGDEKLKDAMVPIATLHLTVMVMHLSSEEEIIRAKLALRDCQDILGPKYSKEVMNIDFHGLGHFNNQVMFAKIKDNTSTVQALYDIADEVEKCYKKYGITSTGDRGFKPHLTVMKLSRAPSLRKKGVRRIKSELYKAHSNRFFGSQPVTGLQLCSINKTKGIDGYFNKASEFFFGDCASTMGYKTLDRILEDSDCKEDTTESKSDSDGGRLRAKKTEADVMRNDE